MDLNQAEVAVTTQHLIDMGQEKDNLLQMSDFGDMGEFLCTCSELFPEEETPEYRYTRWEEMRPISTMSLARTAGMTACCTIRAYQATISTRVFPASRYSMTITIKAYKHIQDGNQLQRTGNAG